jgi:hypothetical protein
MIQNIQKQLITIFLFSISVIDAQFALPTFQAAHKPHNTSSSSISSCKEYLAANSGSSDGIYSIDIDSDGTPETVYCDMTTDGGGWTLLTWNGDVGSSPKGVPYPGLAVCSTADCSRGSAGTESELEPLIQASTEFAKAQHSSTMSTYGPMSDYQYAGKYVYGSLSDLDIQLSYAVCNSSSGYTGSYTPLVGHSTMSGTTVYLAQGFRYASYNYSSDSYTYIWNVGVPYNLCDGSAHMPGSWMGTWSNRQYGPYQRNVGGSHSVWVR